MIIPVILGISAVAAYAARKKIPNPFNISEKAAAERRAIYETALNSKDPVALRKLAAGFREQKCEVEADLLEKRAAICELPRETTLARRDVFRKLMDCKDPEKVRNAALVFEEQGCTGAAADLNRYATGLEDAQKLEAEGMGTNNDNAG